MGTEGLLGVVERDWIVLVAAAILSLTSTYVAYRVMKRHDSLLKTLIEAVHRLIALIERKEKDE